MPGPVNFNALERRFENDLLPHVAVDADRFGEWGQSTEKRRPRFSIADWNMLASSAVRPPISGGSKVA